MQIGYIGLGKMGQNMVERLLDAGHGTVVFDLSSKAVKSMEHKGAVGATSVEMLCLKMVGPKTVWIMVPHQVVDAVLKELAPHMKRGDTVIDGGNSPYEESMRRAKEFSKQGVAYLDVGVSGGPAGARDGACLMIGGDRKAVKKLDPLFQDLATKNGYAYVGPSGAGHFAKMVHNGIEYGMMQAFAEGFDLLRRHPTFSFNLREVAGLYSHGSVVTSRLSFWLEDAFRAFGNALKGVAACAIGTGEGEWTVKTAKALKAPAPVIAQSVKARKRCDETTAFQSQVVMALRNRFGGHDPNPKES